MTHVSEHYTKKEWESYAGKVSRINLLIWGHSISVNNLLEDWSEFVCLDVGWGY
jgi:hypothetical protein